MIRNPATPIGDQLFKFKETLEKRGKYVKNEFQAYGLDLAKELGDWKNRSLYLRLAKNIPREILEKARYFVKDQNPGAIKTPYKLFMWKLKELRKEEKEAKIGV
jgi:hypothetical protein